MLVAIGIYVDVFLFPNYCTHFHSRMLQVFCKVHMYSNQSPVKSLIVNFDITLLSCYPFSQNFRHGMCRSGNSTCFHSNHQSRKTNYHSICTRLPFLFCCPPIAHMFFDLLMRLQMEKKPFHLTQKFSEISNPKFWLKLKAPLVISLWLVSHIAFPIISVLHLWVQARSSIVN